ncbi:hypothetical protein GCM10007231_14530 [Nocardioides daphniae]|uniref:Uncharacterized protein n=1 Tax=Nocardioides daphniae TaxID=402297 RepID=A0ABQ1Q8D8_9ACTN|nr:hypothetical protein [Nocardioides daphniae]GGD16673.1 hypothetical protein GCM10007231_14530 [Nocardioides daphniae]
MPLLHDRRRAELPLLRAHLPRTHPDGHRRPRRLRHPGALGVNDPGLKKAPYRAKVDTALDQLAATLHAEALDPVEPRQTVADLIGFRVARLLVEGGRDEEPVDAAYWDERGWFEADWFSDRPVPKVANRIAAMVEKKIRAGIEEGSAKPFTGGRGRG